MDSASSATSSNPPPTRAQRGAIATQACETCRSRKQKCDEARPKCSLCLRMKLECRYREPQPTKKDKTLVEILDRLKSLEGKVDRIPLQSLRTPAPSGFGPPQSSPSSQPSFNAEPDSSSYSSSSLSRPSYQPSSSSQVKEPPYQHASAPHKMLTWPAIQQLLLQAVPSSIGGLKSLDKNGTAFIVKIQRGAPTLSLDDNLQDQPFLGMQTQATRSAGGIRVTFPSLSRETMHRYATAYFDTFNLMYPFMDRQNFISDTLVRVQTEGFDGDTDSVIALLVFALGELAIKGSHGDPVPGNNSRPSGIRGGSSQRPPGLAIFNEARKRIGFVLTGCTLENVQIFSLAALYYESCLQHLDFWRLTVSACLACQVMITCNTIDWNSPQGDLTKRVFWHCVNMETGLHLELDLPLTGIISLEDQVGMPGFNTPFCEADHRSNQSSHFKAHYISQITLRQLCADLNDTLNDPTRNLDATMTSDDDSPGPTANSLKQFTLRLNQWRGTLPRELQWGEDDPTGFPSPRQRNIAGFNQPLDPDLSPAQGHMSHPLFSSDLDCELVHYPYLYDLQVALLRTRYYYAKYMVYRPFLYKAVHFPELMTREDAEGVAECLRSCLKWPITLSPTSRRKRLVPYLFCWSQTFLGILLIFHMSQHNPMLRDIKQQLCGPRFEAELGESQALMIDWIKDLRGSDPLALWCSNVLRGIYNMD